MKILVLSDSHAGLSFMRTAVRTVKPDAIVHLGDYFDDGQTIAQENMHIPIYQVPGNCDRYRCFGKSELLCLDIFGVRIYMTHGHNQAVKHTLAKLVVDAEAFGAVVALYGHTHISDCHREPSGLWVVNPGSCGNYSGSVAVLEIQEGKVLDCRILTADELTS